MADSKKWRTGLGRVAKSALEKLGPKPAKAKIVGLMPARNEGAKIQTALRALAMHTDAIVYLDDCSTDDTLRLVEECRDECRIERILTKEVWFRDEPADRNRLLQTGREIGGTHFIVLDADEMLTANCLDGDLLRKRIFGLSKGGNLQMRWIHVWGEVGSYRTDGPLGVERYKSFAFRDDGKSAYVSRFIHTFRVPDHRIGRERLDDPNFGVIHFQFVDFDNVRLKWKWYAWMEKIHKPEASMKALLDQYELPDVAGLVTKPCPPEWFDRYDFFDPKVFAEPDGWRLDQLKEWEQTHGAAFFEPETSEAKG